MRERHIYSADFENTTNTESTYVYGAGIMELTEEEPHIFDTIEEFINYVSTLPKNSFVFFHNLSYDAMLIMYYLLTHGYTENTSGKGTFEGIISDDAQFYELTVRFPKTTVRFRDSAKLVQGKLDTIGKNLKCATAKMVGAYDYDSIEEGHIMNDTERQYLRNDVVLLKEILIKLNDIGMLDFLTAAGYAFHHLKESLYNEKHHLSKEEAEAHSACKFFKKDIQESFRNTFPLLPDAHDYDIRKSYRGGYCINWSDGEIHENRGIVLDFSSLYPSSMVNEYYPYGSGRYFEGDIPEEGFEEDKVFFVKLSVMFKVKPHHLPFIQIKNSQWADNEYISEVYDEVEIWLNSYDYKLFHEQYDVIHEEQICGYVFDAYNHFFDGFIEYYYDMKANAPDKTTRLRVKIILNSSYGKFGQRLVSFSGHPYINDDNTISFGSLAEYDAPASAYIPVASCCTAIARCKTIRNAQKLLDKAAAEGKPDDYYLQYIDTDSLHIDHMTVEEAEKILPIHPTRLGWLKVECEYDKARWVRQKTYIEHIIIEDGEEVNPFWNIKCCGLNDEGKEMLRQSDDIAERFAYGLVLPKVKISKHRCIGGVCLKKGDFTIKK